MPRLPKLNLPACRLRARREGLQTRVWSAPRGLWVVLTPEEWVRRHWVAHLCGALGVPPQLVVEEYPVPLNGTRQRADIVVCDRQGRPRLVVECKAPEVALDEAVLDQALRYNGVLGATYLIISNGLIHRAYALHAERYAPLDALPALRDDLL